MLQFSLNYIEKSNHLFDYQISWALLSNKLIVKYDGFDPDNIVYTDHYGAFNLYETDDTILFDKKTLNLEYLSLNIPERNSEHSRQINLNNRISTTMRLKQGIEHFVLEETFCRHLDINKNMLICLTLDNNFTSLDYIQIANDFFFLFDKNEYVGWLVNNPIIYLTDMTKKTVHHNSSPILELKLKAYFEIVNDSNIDLLEDQNPFLKEKLNNLKNDLYSEIQLSRNEKTKGKLSILLNGITNIIETFY